MANIVTRLTLEGAAAIKAELTALGTAGKAAWDKLGEVQAVGGRLNAAGAEMQKLTANVKAFGQAASQAGKDGAAFGNALHSSLTRLTVVAAGLGLAFGKIVETFKAVGAEAEVLQQNADAAGLSTKEYESLTLALGQNGVGSAEAGKAMDKTAKFMVAAKDQSDAYDKQLKKLNESRIKDGLSSKDYNEKLKDLNDNMGSAKKLVAEYGLKLTDASGELRNVRDFSLEFGEALKKSGKSVKDNNAALEVFGKAGRKIGQAFGQGREALEILEERAQRLAPSLTEAAQKSVTGMDDAFDQLGQTGKSLQRELVSIFAGQVTGVVATFTEAISDNRAAFIRFAESIRDQVKPAVLELLNFMNSPDFSLKLQGALVTARDVAIAFGQAIRDIVIPAIKGIIGFADQVAAGINKVFGTQLTGGALLFALVIGKVTGLLTVFTTGLTFAASSGKLLWAAFQVLRPAITAAVVAAGPMGIALIAIAIAIGTLVGLLIRYSPQIKQFFYDAFVGVVDTIKAAWNGLGEFFAMTAQNFIIVWTAFKSFLAGLWSQAMQNAKDNWQGIANAINAAYAAVTGVWTAAKEWFDKNVWQPIVALATAAWDGIKGGAQSLFDFIVSAASAPFTALKNAMSDWWNWAKGIWDSAISKAKEYLTAQNAAGGTGGGGDAPQSNAAGGYIRGRGTGTSDSILSWLSNGEFVVKAKAVQHYGPQLLSAINNMRLPRFNTGGMVEAAQTILLPGIPRFAGGGPVTAPTGGGGRPMVLQIGDQVISGLTANSGAVETLQKYASQKAVRSAGRKPLWFKG